MVQTALVTIVGIQGLNPGLYDVKIGHQLYFEKDTTNRDPFAIKVFASKGGASIGYVANATNTVFPGTISATNVHPLFEECTTGKVIYEDTVTFQNGRSSRGFIVELTITEITKEEVKMDKTIKFKLVGAVSKFPNKYKVIDDFKNGKMPYVTLSVDEDKIVAEYDGVQAGYIEMKDQDGLSTCNEILAAVKDGQVAKITRTITTNVIAEFKVDASDLAINKEVRSLKLICEQLIMDGLATEEEIQERITYMKKSNVTEKQMSEVFESYKPYRDEVAALIPIITNDTKKVLYQDGGEHILLDCIAYMNGDRNLLFEGDRGVGKNVLIETLAWLYKRPLYEFSINSQHDNNSLLGGKTFETDEDGKTKMEFDIEATVKAVVEGGILNLDEINTGLAHVMIIFNPLLDHRRRITIPGYGTVEAHPNFIAIGSMNKDYQGTFELNESTEDRFVPIIFPTATSIKETLMARVPQVGLPIINQCDALYIGLKKVVEDGEISDKALSVRGFVDACIGVDKGLPLKRTLITNVANRCKFKEDRIMVTNLINAQIR